MKTVYKYMLTLADHVDTMMPEGAEIVHFGNQGDIPTLWALVDTDAPMVRRSFRIAGTGHPIEEKPLCHLGTAFFYGGALVFHCFEVQA